MATLIRRRIFIAATLVYILSLASFTAQSLDNNDVEDDSNPLLDIASSFLQNSMNDKSGGAGLGALGGILGTFMQGEGGKQIGDLLVGMQGGNKNNAAGDVLSSLGSLFANKEGGGIDPSLLSSMINVFAESAMGSKNEEEKPRKKVIKKESIGVQRKDPKPKASEDFDMSGLLNVASAFLGSQKAAGNGNKEHNLMEDVASALPAILNTLNSFSGPEAEAREHKHADHAWFLPPLFEKVHVFWDHFIHSDLGRAVWENAGLSEMTKTFVDENGQVDFETILKSLENHSFRRRWIKTATNYLAEWATHMANPEVQQRYLSSSQFVINGFLKSQGFPKHIMFQPTKFPESVSIIANYVLKKYLNTPTDVSIYVKPAVLYVKDIVNTAAKSHGKYLQSLDKNSLSDKLTDTLNLEIIEPILKVYRAYRFAKKSRHCQTHVLCVINRHNPNEQLGLPGFKAGLTKISSFVASAALSYQGGLGFLDLYSAIQEDSNCQAKYPADCDEFHEEEIKVTTEYYHNEL